MRRAKRVHDANHREDSNSVPRPGLLRMALEWRAGLEYGAGLATRPLLRFAPRGDGHPVLVLPGMLAGDLTTRPLRRCLKRLNYVPYGWEQGINLGPRAGVMQRCLALLQGLRRTHNRKVSLIGWSLGGIYARELAKAVPEHVRVVITLGTPFTGHPKATNAWRLYEWLTGHRIGAPDIHGPLRKPPRVPTTSIFSRTDGIVAWQCSVEHPGPISESIEVEASHLGMGFNPLALYAIADRLSQPEGAWQPFERQGLRRLIYGSARRSGGP
ncbi:MAG TPA: alpha/beta hydrolase [Steroidobacteraceae bacterium]|nr:alpha/beta hydrolase [Steroidobacteraceae bacterium]